MVYFLPIRGPFYQSKSRAFFFSQQSPPPPQIHFTLNHIGFIGSLFLLSSAESAALFASHRFAKRISCIYIHTYNLAVELFAIPSANPSLLPTTTICGRKGSSSAGKRALWKAKSKFGRPPDNIKRSRAIIIFDNKLVCKRLFANSFLQCRRSGTSTPASHIPQPSLPFCRNERHLKRDGKLSARITLGHSPKTRECHDASIPS